MAVSVSAQTLDFFLACLVGAALGLLYDGLRILRLAARPRNFTVFVQDFLFMAVCAVVTFLLLLREAMGVVRLFLIGGELLGALLWSLTLGMLLMRLARRAVPGVSRMAHRTAQALRPRAEKAAGQVDGYVLKKGRKAKKLYRKESKLLKIRLKVAQTMLYNLIHVQKARHKAEKPDKMQHRRHRREKKAP